MRVMELWRYPVKSLAGEQLAEAEIGPLGIPSDRELVVQDEGGKIQDARSRPGLLRLRATLGPEGRVRINGTDWEDPDVARWVRQAAGPTARLSRFAGSERFDVLPLLVTTDGAIAALGVDHRRLRPNLVIGDVPGLTERDWEGRYLAINTAVIGLANLRTRCIMTTFDPETGVQDRGVLERIRREFSGTFALNAWTARPGRVRVGDPVSLLEGFEAPETPLYGRYARAARLPPVRSHRRSSSTR